MAHMTHMIHISVTCVVPSLHRGPPDPPAESVTPTTEAHQQILDVEHDNIRLTYDKTHLQTRPSNSVTVRREGKDG